MSANFKTCMFGGFDRRDVISYIEKFARESNERIKALEQENAELKTSHDHMEQALRTLHAQAKQHRREEEGQESVQQQLAAAQTRLNEAEGALDAQRAENDTLRTENELLRAESEKFRAAANEYMRLKEHIADIEINAHRRTEEFRAEAIEKLRQSIAEQRTWCQAQRGQYALMNESILQELHRAEEILQQNDLAGFDSMMESLQSLEDSLQ